MHEEALGGNLKISGDFSCSAWLHYCRFCSRYQTEKIGVKLGIKKKTLTTKFHFFLSFIVSKSIKQQLWGRECH